MAEINKTTFKGLGLPEHFDPSLDVLKNNMNVIDGLLQKAVPNALNTVSEGESNLNTLIEPGTYYAKAGATGCPSGTTSYSGVVHVFKSGTYVLQEWRSVNNPSFCGRRYSTNSGSSWGNWYKEWNQNNDGSGSGLDADLLDSNEATAFAKVNQSTSNFNSATTPGFWYVNSTTNAPHTSCSYWGCMVFRTGSATGNSYLIQVASARGTSNTDTSTNNTLGLFYRKYYNGAWLSWNTIWDSSRNSSGINAQFLQGFTPENVSVYSITGSNDEDHPTYLNQYSAYNVIYIRSGYVAWDCGDDMGLWIAQNEGNCLVIKSQPFVDSGRNVVKITSINHRGIKTHIVGDDGDGIIPIEVPTDIDSSELGGHIASEYALKEYVGMRTLRGGTSSEPLKVVNVQENCPVAIKNGYVVFSKPIAPTSRLVIECTDMYPFIILSGGTEKEGTTVVAYVGDVIMQNGADMPYGMYHYSIDATTGNTTFSNYLENTHIPTIAGASSPLNAIPIDDTYGTQESEHTPILYVKSGYFKIGSGDTDFLVAPALITIEPYSAGNSDEVVLFDSADLVTVINYSGITTYEVSFGSYTSTEVATRLNVTQLNGYYGDEYTLKSEILDELKEVDGDGSGLDSDLLDGLHKSGFVKHKGLVTELPLIETGETDSCQIFMFFDNDGVISGLPFALYTVIQQYVNSLTPTKTLRFAISVATGDIYTQVTGSLVWNKYGDNYVQKSKLPEIPVSGNVTLIGHRSSTDSGLAKVQPSDWESTNAGSSTILRSTDYDNDCAALKAAYDLVPAGGTLSLYGYFLIEKDETYRSESQYYRIIEVRKNITIESYGATIVFDRDMPKTEGSNNQMWVELFYIHGEGGQAVEKCNEFTIKNLNVELYNDSYSTNNSFHRLVTTTYQYNNTGVTPTTITLEGCRVRGNQGWLNTDLHQKDSCMIVRNCDIEIEGTNTALSFECANSIVTGNRLKGSTGFAHEGTWTGVFSGNTVIYDRTGIAFSLYSKTGLTVTGNVLHCTGENLSVYDPNESNNSGYFTRGIYIYYYAAFSYDSYVTWAEYGITITDNKIETYDMGIDFDFRFQLQNSIIKDNVIVHCRPTANALAEYGDTEQTEPLRETLTYAFWCTRVSNCIIEDNNCVIRNDTTNFPNGFPTYVQIVDEKSKIDVGQGERRFIINVNSDSDVDPYINPINLTEIGDKCVYSGAYTFIRKYTESVDPVPTGYTVEDTHELVLTYKVLVTDYGEGYYKDSNQHTTYDSVEIGHGSIYQNREVFQVLFLGDLVYSRVATYTLEQTTMPTTGSYKPVATEIKWVLSSATSWNRLVSQAQLIQDIKDNDGSGSGIDSDLLDGRQGSGFVTHSGFITGTLPTTNIPSTAYSTYNQGQSTIYFYQDTNNVIGGGAGETYTIIHVRPNINQYYTMLALGVSNGKLYRKTSSKTAWNEIAQNIPVLSSDPANPSEGQMWILNTTS